MDIVIETILKTNIYMLDPIYVSDKPQLTNSITPITNNIFLSSNTNPYKPLNKCMPGDAYKDSLKKVARKSVSLSIEYTLTSLLK